MEMSVAFIEIVEMSHRLGVKGINTLPGCWEVAVDDHWWIAVNGHKEPIKCSRDIEVDPFTCYVEFNGWPAGVFQPNGGCIAAGSLANEDTFIAALRKKGAEHGCSPQT